MHVVPIVFVHIRHQGRLGPHTTKALASTNIPARMVEMLGREDEVNLEGSASAVDTGEASIILEAAELAIDRHQGRFPVRPGAGPRQSLLDLFGRLAVELQGDEHKADV